MTEPERFHSLDALRASALLLGIALHATMSFLPGFRELRWPISDVETSTSMGVFFYVVHIFRMATFFLVAGFFARLLFERLGSGGFIKNRLRRIALPLLAFFPVVMPLCILPIIWAAKNAGITGPGPGAPQNQGFPWGHFWFLYLLLVLYALMLIVRTILAAVDRGGSVRSFIDRLLHIAFSFRIAPLLLAAPLAALLFATPWWLQWSGIPAPLYGFVPSFPSVAIFGTSVLFGWCLHRQQSLFEFLRRDYALYLIVAVLASFAALYLVGVRMNMTVIPMSPGIRAAYAGVYMLAVWCVVGAGRCGDGVAVGAERALALPVGRVVLDVPGSRPDRLGIAGLDDPMAGALVNQVRADPDDHRRATACQLSLPRAVDVSRQISQWPEISARAAARHDSAGYLIAE